MEYNFSVVFFPSFLAEEASGSGSGSDDGLYGNPLIGSDESSRDGLPSEIVIDPVIDPRFSIEGEGGSLLIIDLFAPELNGTIIYCRDEDEGDLVAFFRLRSTRTLQRWS